MKYSILDLANINQHETPKHAFERAVALAKLGEKEGYHRFWVAEHHNMVNIASSATAVLMGHIAGKTETIRVGSGGIMLPNHAPLMVAEAFGTLETLYPGRIDLGLGRAPGTDQITSHALRRDPSRAEQFPSEVMELLSYFHPEDNQKINAIPGMNLEVPVWVLGSSLFGAQLAAHLGLPYAFAGHFAPTHMSAALKIYRERFQPSQYLSKPYSMLCLNAVLADSTEEAQFQFTTMQQSFTQLIRDDRKLTPPPIETMDDYWNTLEKRHVTSMLRLSAIGDQETARDFITDLLSEIEVDELMFAGVIYDPEKRLHSFKLLSDVMQSL
ncbi:MAG TPA: LLM class flavin-dependent oxidoreductase [Candidatus Ignatzschineria merdigallinarum]|uniref:Luciferase-like monooxygenase n=1 Tax=Candidatus Ignatzschineria merdigallinarum TaxID=2838621 RepID=A0A9D1Q590_9GAMM|nr:LLM class flavin-dependent oxidoreductase [Candidatus Ignatzschineria merdigallinarum]